jgi:DNA-binding LytR/AlgR family response regulator
VQNEPFMNVNTPPKIISGFSDNSINRLEACSNYTLIYSKDGSQHISSYSLKVFAEHFRTKHFIRINRSILVNTSFVKKHFKSGGKEYLQLKDNTTILIPRRKSESLKMSYPTLFNH